MVPHQTAPQGSSLIWAHIVCNIGYLRRGADDKCRGRREKRYRDNKNQHPANSQISLDTYSECVI